MSIIAAPLFPPIAERVWSNAPYFNLNPLGERMRVDALVTGMPNAPRFICLTKAVTICDTGRLAPKYGTFARRLRSILV